MPKIKHRLVGEVSYHVLPKLKNGTIPLDMDDAWEAANIVRVTVPQLNGVDDGTSGGSTGVIRFHKRGVAQLLAAFAEVEARGLLHHILAFAGSYYPRMIRGSTASPSEHSFGTALDLNAPWNGLGRTPAKEGTEGSMHEVAAVFKRHGFEWGGDWQGRKDGMHLQVKEWLAAQTHQEPVAAPKPITPHQVLSLNGHVVNGAILQDGHFVSDVVEVLKALGLSYATDLQKTGPTQQYLKVYQEKK